MRLRAEIVGLMFGKQLGAGPEPLQGAAYVGSGAKALENDRGSAARKRSTSWEAGSKPHPILLDRPVD